MVTKNRICAWRHIENCPRGGGWEMQALWAGIPVQDTGSSDGGATMQWQHPVSVHCDTYM